MATREVGNLRTRLSWEDEGSTRSLKGFRDDLRGLRSEMSAAKGMGNEYRKSLKGLRDQSDILNRTLKTHRERVAELKKRYEESSKVKGVDADQTKRLATQYNNAVAQMNRTEDQLKKVTDAIEEQVNPWKNLARNMEEAGTKMQNFGRGMADFGRSYSMRVTAPIVASSAAVFKASMDYESAFAGVRKTVDMTESEYESLSRSIRDMAKEIPAAATEIAGVAEAAGQLGIQNDAILQFTRTMTDLGVATNMTAEQAATNLARFANITKMSQSDFDKLGSTIVDLGNNFATTEQEIVEMALRLGGAGAQIGMSEADILGLATALSSVGIRAEMGGSAISRVMVNMQVATSTGFTKVQELMKTTGNTVRELQMMASHSGKEFGDLAEELGMTKKELSSLVNAGVDLENFAKIAGMTGAEFKKAFEEDAIGAMGAFISGLGNAEQAGESAINMLQEMGITEIQLRDSLLRSGGAHELLAGAIETSNTAWEENTALTKEAEQRYGTTESKIKMMWNRIKDMAITLGDALVPAVMDAIDAAEPLIEKIESGAKAFSDMDKEQQRTILKLIGLAAAIGPASILLGNMTTVAGGTFKMLGSLSGAIGRKGAGRAGLAGSLTGLVGVTGPLALTAAGIAGVTIAGVELYKHLKEDSIPEIDRFGDSVSDATKKALGSFMELNDEATVQLNELKWSGKAVSEEMRDSLVSNFNDMGSQIVQGLEERKNESIAALQSLFAESDNITKEEQQKILENVSKGYETRAKLVESGNAEILEILEKAAEENRALTEVEQNKINYIQQKGLDTALEVLTENEREQKVILERMKNQSEELSARQAAEVVKNSIKQKDEVVAEAEQQYSLAVAEIIRQRDEMGTITAEQAQTMIENARKQRDDTVSAAEEMHERIVEEAKLMAGDYLNEINWLTGEVKTKWEMLQTDSVKITTRSFSLLKQGWKTLKEDVLGIADDIVKQTNYKFDKLRDLRLPSVVNPTASRGNQLLPSYAVGTSDHPGGSFIAGEEGFELGRLGNRWEMLDFGMYNRPRGYQVFTHDESKEILKALYNMPAYATGARPIGEANRVVSGLSESPVNIHVAQLVVREEADVGKVAKELQRLQTRNRRVVLG